MYMPIMPWAGLGQLHANNYPAGWYAAKTYLDTTPHRKILFLPWNLYMHMDFAGKTIANPGKPFFGRELITSDDAGLGLIANQSFDPFSQKMTGWLEMRNQLTNFGEQLKPDSISHIILVKESDWLEYNFLSHQPDLDMVYSNDNLIIYRVK